jgi:hypothetical protein
MTSPALMAALEKTRPAGAPSEPLTSTATVLKTARRPLPAPDPGAGTDRC